MNKKCPICKKKFEYPFYSRRYCSLECRQKAVTKQKEKRKLRNKKIRFCRKCKIKEPLGSFAHYCEECNKEVMLEQNEKNKIRAIKNAIKFYGKNKNKKSFKFKRNERYKIYHKRRMNTDVQFATAVRLRNLLYHALKKYTKKGKAFSSKTYGINFDEIIEHLKPFPPDIKKYHIDHIKPLSSFNLEDPEEIRKAFAPENHQWLLGSENLSKSNKWSK